VAALGPRAAEFLRDLPQDCFGVDSVYDRLIQTEAKMCNVGVGLRYATIVHHVEQMMGVPYRFKKPFRGQTMLKGTLDPQTWDFNVRVLVPNASVNLSRMEAMVRDRGVCASAEVGRGQVTTIYARDMWDLCSEGIKSDPWFLAEGPPEDLTKAIEKDLATANCVVGLED
jgi:aminoglycoside 3-N-acetyltransferase